MSDVSVREIASYYVKHILEAEIEKHKDIAVCESDRVEHFMGSYLPTYRFTKSRKEKFVEHVGKLLERAYRPVATTVKTYEDK